MVSETRDAFICYSGKDRKIVEQIVGCLERKYAITTWYAPADVRGEKFMQWMQQCIPSSRVGVVFLSPSSITASWAESEWEMMGVLQSRGVEYKIIVVLVNGLPEDKIPLWLARYDRVDFRDIDHGNYLGMLTKVTDLARKIKPERVPGYMKAGKPIPIAILAMTRSEFHNVMRRDSKCLRRLGYQCRWEDLQSMYGEIPEDWRPSDESKTIREIVEEVIERVNAETPEFLVSPLYPIFVSDDFKAQEEQVRLKVWKALDREGGILIVDAISLCHAKLRECLEKSELSSKPNVAVIMIYPPDPTVTPRDCPADDFVKAYFPRAFSRFECDWDEICEFGVRQEVELRRRLFSLSRKVGQMMREAQPDPEKQKQMSERVAQPQGYGEWFFGRGER